MDDATLTIAPSMIDGDLRTILEAWNTATMRLEETHLALQAEVRRLSDELEAKNRELARRNRLADLGQMASHVAHEVRNSLVPMKLYLTLLRRRMGHDADTAQLLEQFVSGFSALETTVNDLLHFSSDRDPSNKKFVLEPLLREIIASLAPQLDAQKIQATVDADPKLVIYADRDMIRRAVLNLVLNAIDVMPEGGSLIITAVATAHAIDIEVADSGSGIGESTLAHLFEPFFTTKSSGTGLGLAIVERIAEAHGGHIIACNCPDGGAAFTISIPRQNEEPRS
ncbi:histidine kinase [Pirellula staleyi DSM 6068]|uniref:histidine kinase n=1 Tax=Pirellula staleyi (strain ATCC 27377 / DSM 6068 / ICPB 4128) TaxID=530564 RepID=D2R520_PIRSD|nr:HAMP domain-containing sensor histidine kinase [Pirellula staleyi]ADB18982.1 histidine kinase [Pirellula staleyi DSM 6068]